MRSLSSVVLVLASLCSGVLALDCNHAGCHSPVKRSSIPSVLTPTAQPVCKVCDANSCLKAVIGPAPTVAPDHQEDCSSYLRVTVYPETITATNTMSIAPVFSTITSTLSTVTLTDTEYPFTSTASQVVTTVIISTTYSTEIVTVATATVTVSAGGQTVKKRSTVAPASSEIPIYANACGAAQYSSACDCVGVSQTTVTMPTPSTTVTMTIEETSTATDLVTETAVETLSETATVSLDISTTTTASFVETDIATATVISTKTPDPTGTGYCENGSRINAVAAPCATGPCKTFNLRIEGNEGTVFEGPVNSGPRTITTPSGGTHKCDGTNNNANPSPGATGIGPIDVAGSLCGFTYDGTYSTNFQDFFITRIGASNSNATPNQFWGILNNFAFTPTGGCEYQPGANDELLWAFNAFNVNFFLDVQPRTATVAAGSTMVFTVRGGDGNGNFSPVAGALFNGQLSNGNGQVQFVATVPGTYRIKATRADSIRSPAVTIVVT